MTFNPLKTSILRVGIPLLILSNLSTAQSVTGVTGATQWMLGGSSAAHSDVWSANNNAAAMIPVKKIQGGLYTEQRFNEQHLRLANVSLVVPSKYIHLGASVNYFGYTAFNQQKVALSAAKSISRIFSLGIQLNYISTFIEGYGQAGNAVLAGGLYMQPSSKLTIGFVIFNPTQNTYGTYTNEKIPSYGRLGCSYQASDKIILHGEADQSLNSSLAWRGGVYYKIHPILHLALGAATNPGYYTFGTCLFIRNFKFDLASSFHEVLGPTPHLGISLPVSN